MTMMKKYVECTCSLCKKTYIDDSMFSIEVKEVELDEDSLDQRNVISHEENWEMCLECKSKVVDFMYSLMKEKADGTT